MRFKRRIFVHLIYGCILFVTCLSTLEQFSALNDDVFNLSPNTFHLITVSLSLAIAIFEGFSMKGFDTIKAFFDKKEYIPNLPYDGTYSFKVLGLEEISDLQKLARKIYGSGYSFSEKKLKEWWRSNQNCFYGMYFNNVLVGYFDGFPVNKKDYEHLVAGKDERKIVPLNTEGSNEAYAFYIASFVVDPQHCNQVIKFINKGMNFYSVCYPSRPWNIVCAFAYTPKGLAWCDNRGMAQLDKSDVWSIDRNTLKVLNKRNQAFWQSLF